MSEETATVSKSTVENVVVCSHATDNRCPLSAKKCMHKKPHTFDQSECQPSECKLNGDDDIEHYLNVKCVPHNGRLDRQENA